MLFDQVSGCRFEGHVKGAFTMSWQAVRGHNCISSQTLDQEYDTRSTHAFTQHASVLIKGSGMDSKTVHDASTGDIECVAGCM